MAASTAAVSAVAPTFRMRFKTVASRRYSSDMAVDVMPATANPAASVTMVGSQAGSVAQHGEDRRRQRQANQEHRGEASKRAAKAQAARVVADPVRQAAMAERRHPHG